MKANGLYVSPNEFVRFAEPGKTISQHIATRDRSPDFFALGMYLPNPDPILKKQGRDIRVYQDLRSDAHVGGCIRRRKAAIQALEWRVVRGTASARSARLAQEVLQRLDLPHLLHEMMDAVLYGWAPLEVLWSAPGAGPTVPLQVLGKPVHWFTFDVQGELRFLTREQPFVGEAVMPRKFLLPTQEASYANPYGFADLSMCFWPTVFKRGGLKFWVTFTEKFGTPWVVGKTPRGTPEPENSALLDQLEAMVQDAVAVIPDDASIDIKEAAGKSGSADLYERLLMFCRSEVAIALLGQNQSTEASANKASASAGLEVAQSLRDGDARLCEATINTLLRWLVDSNEGEAAPAPKFELFEQAEVDEVQARRDKLLFDAGLRFTPAYWQRVYALEEGDIASAPVEAAASRIAQVPEMRLAAASTASAAYAEPPATATAKRLEADPTRRLEAASTAASPTAALDAALAKAGDGVLAAWMAQVAELVQAADSPEALRDDLLAAYGDLPTEQLAQVMALAFAVAELQGMTRVAQEGAAAAYAEPLATEMRLEAASTAATPDPRLDQISASVVALQSSMEALAAARPLVIHNTIAVPEQAAPVVNVAAPVVNVPAPIVNVTNDVQSAPVTVNNAFASKAVQTVQRDANDEITSTTTTYE